MKTTRWITAAAAFGALLLTGCGATPDASTAPENGTVAADNLATAMLAWELQTDTERGRICAAALTHGTDETARGFSEKNGDSPDEWRAAARWLTDTCEER